MTRDDQLKRLKAIKDNIIPLMAYMNGKHEGTTHHPRECITNEIFRKAHKSYTLVCNAINDLEDVIEDDTH